MIIGSPTGLLGSPPGWPPVVYGSNRTRPALPWPFPRCCGVLRHRCLRPEPGEHVPPLGPASSVSAAASLYARGGAPVTVGVLLSVRPRPMTFGLPQRPFPFMASTLMRRGPGAAVRGAPRGALAGLVHPIVLDGRCGRHAAGIALAPGAGGSRSPDPGALPMAVGGHALSCLCWRAAPTFYGIFPHALEPTIPELARGPPVRRTLITASARRPAISGPADAAIRPPRISLWSGACLCGAESASSASRCPVFNRLPRPPLGPAPAADCPGWNVVVGPSNASRNAPTRAGSAPVFPRKGRPRNASSRDHPYETSERSRLLHVDAYTYRRPDPRRGLSARCAVIRFSCRRTGRALAYPPPPRPCRSDGARHHTPQRCRDRPHPRGFLCRTWR